MSSEMETFLSEDSLSLIASGDPAVDAIRGYIDRYFASLGGGPLSFPPKSFFAEMDQHFPDDEAALVMLSTDWASVPVLCLRTSNRYRRLLAFSAQYTLDCFQMRRHGNPRPTDEAQPARIPSTHG